MTLHQRHMWTFVWTMLGFLVGWCLWGTGASAQTKSGRFQFYTYQFMDANTNDQCVYVFYAGQPPTISLTSVVISGACTQ